MNFSELELLLRFPYQTKGQPTLVDVGAHIGTSAYPFAQKSWRVIAFEPEPENRRQLENNLQNYPNVTIVPKAVSDKAGQEIPFYVSSEHWGIHSLKPFHDTHKPQLTVETVRLDTTLKELGVEQVSLLKIDVEGADFLALQSFDFSKMQPEVVMCEFMDDRSQSNFDYSHHDMARYMEERGYHVFVSEWSPIKEYAKKGKATAPHQFLAFSRYPLNHQPAWGNLIFVRQDRLADFEEALSSYINVLKNQSPPPTRKAAKPQIALEQLLAQYEIALKQQSYELIVDSLRRIVQNYPSYQPATIQLSDLLLQAGKLQEARILLDGGKANLPESAAVKERMHLLSIREKLLEDSHQKIEAFKNKHEGERCVIIGNGPSLNKMDLSFLKNEICFGLNRIYLGFEKWGFVPNYYVSVNKFVIEQSADEIFKLPCTKFVSVAGLPYLSSQKDLILINSVSWKDFFSTNPRDGLCIGSTVTYVTLQLAYYMGFKTVILIGVDHNFETKGTPHKLIVSEGDDPNHFHPEYFGKGVRWQLPDLEGSERMYKLADAYFKAKGGQVIDATFEGHCPIFEKANYQELFFDSDGNIGSKTSLIPINEICNYAYQYQKNQTDESLLFQLRQGRQQIARQWLDLSAEEVKYAYTGDLGRVHQAIVASSIKSEAITDEEKNFVEDIEAKIAKGLEPQKAIQNLLVAMLYRPGDRLQFNLNAIPDWLFEDYLKYLLEERTYFQEIGEARSYCQYLERLINDLHANIFQNRNSQKWQEAAGYFQEKANLLPLHSSNRNFKNTYTKRAEILAAYLETTHETSLDWNFPEPSSDESKIRIGILAEEFSANKETFASLPVYKSLNRDVFEIILYTLKKTENRLEKYCVGHANALIELPQNLLSQVQLIRDAELDILFVAGNVTAKTTPITLLALHRLARIQLVDATSPVTTGMRHIDYYISGQLSDPEQAQQHYTETLVTLDGWERCFDFATEDRVLPTANISRESLGIHTEAVVYISGASFNQIPPEVEATWAKIVASVPNSVLLLYQSDPNSSLSESTIAFRQRIATTFARHGIGEDKAIALTSTFNRADVKKLLQLGDVYLDTYYYSDVISLLEALEVGLPGVVMDGELPHTNRGTSLLRSLQLDDLIGDSEKAYLKLAVDLGTNSELRQQHQARIAQTMQGIPPFLDSRSYSTRMGILLEKLFYNYLGELLKVNFRLREINFIIFPDWSQSEEAIYNDFARVFKAIASHPDKARMTLLVNTSNIDEEDADMAISSMVMNLLMEEDLDVEEGPEISLVGELAYIQWEALLSCVRGIINLEHENKEAIAQVKAENIRAIKLDILPEKIK